VSIQGKVFFVSDYGAYPNDDIDDANSIQLAIDAAINFGINNSVIFGSGTYYLSAALTISNGTNLIITGEGIDQTWLIGTGPISIFSVKYCNGIKITSLSIDFDPLPFTAGYVVNVNNSYLDVQVQPPHQTDIDRQVHGILRYDPLHMRPAFGPNTYEIYQTLPENVTTTIVSPGILRIPLRRPSKFLVGDPIVARYSFNSSSISAQESTDFTVQSIHIYTSWLMGIITGRVKRLNIIDFHVQRHNERWMSTIVDCLHLTDIREYVSITDSRCESMGDDGLNIHAPYFNIIEVINSTALIIQSPVNGFPYIETGIHLEFSSHKQPFTVYATAEVMSLKPFTSNASLFIFANPINASVNDWVCVADTPLVTIRNFTVANNRARGALLQSRNVDMRQSLFNRTSGPAVLFQPSLFWYEGPDARNVTLTENTYINCNEGIAQYKGIITVLPDPIQLVQVINDIRIESSTFIFGNYSQGLLQSNNANNIFISGNYIVTNNSMPLISICNSRNISASNNCVVNNQTKIDEYYTFDQTNPCQMNLSSLIDLPPSAFNSSFPPSVLMTDSSFQNNQNLFIIEKNKSTL
jgi:hypothetical protein